MKNLFQITLWSALSLSASPLFAQNYNLQLRATMDFPGQTLANICGYAQGGREYALLGGSQGLIIVDVTLPSTPQQIVQIPGPNNLWKEIKTYSHYAYVTSEGGQGVQIVDLSNLPSANLNYHYYKGDASINDQLNTIHALHIDTKKGFLYAFGSNLFNGGAVVLDLNADPYNPSYAGKFDQLGYIHDGYADNDTLYAAHIYEGLLSVVDMSNKAAPEVLGTVETPGQFTHNAWLLDDHKHILTTDEATPSFVTAYDISDPNDIQELDRISTNDGNGSIGHNTHVLNDWAITSWYTDGLTIVDAHRPDNLVEVARYDTWAPPLGNGFFEGCWGVYPFLPSGTIVASNIDPARLTILTPTYLRACYLEGSVTSGCTGQPLADATIAVNSNQPAVNTSTANNGTFKTGQAVSGNFVVSISKPGFATQNIPVNFVPGEVVTLNVTLEISNAVNVAGTVVDAATQQPIANAPLEIASNGQYYQLQTSANGQFSLDCVAGGLYRAFVAQWGYLPAQIAFNSTGNPVIALQKGYYDDFGAHLGWATATTASSGEWTRGEPVGTTFEADACNPDFDVDFDGNDECYVTGNGGGSSGNDDVDNGTVTLTSPTMQLADYQDATLSFWYWFFNASGQSEPNDELVVKVLSGNQTVTVFSQNISASEWRYSGEISLANFVPMADGMRVQFSTADQPGTGHLVEAGLDAFQVVPGELVVSAVKPEVDARAFLAAAPNPSSDGFGIGYAWEAAPEGLRLEVRNVLGQLAFSQTLDAASGTLRCGGDWQPGFYFATLQSGARQSAPLKLVKN
jgi:choice-of-anchor B domain-containing protein